MRQSLAPVGGGRSYHNLGSSARASWAIDAAVIQIVSQEGSTKVFHGSGVVSENIVRVQETGMPAADDLLNQLAALGCGLGGDQRPDGETSERVADGQAWPRRNPLRPVKGSESGPRWHWQLRLMRQTWLASGSIKPRHAFVVAAEDADLLAEVRPDHEIQELTVRRDSCKRARPGRTVPCGKVRPGAPPG